ncbi:hypothetical protein ONZ45_g3073 [Pleurotus djamor]|nr:hypothetical protein ONZ45_g3073 [Pleurotus djamor]
MLPLPETTLYFYSIISHVFDAIFCLVPCSPSSRKVVHDDHFFSEDNRQIIGYISDLTQERLNMRNREDTTINGLEHIPQMQSTPYEGSSIIVHYSMLSLRSIKRRVAETPNSKAFETPTHSITTSNPEHLKVSLPVKPHTMRSRFKLCPRNREPKPSPVIVPCPQPGPDSVPKNVTNAQSESNRTEGWLRDEYNGNISGGNVGGRGNTNTNTNTTTNTVYHNVGPGEPSQRMPPVPEELQRGGQSYAIFGMKMALREIEEDIDWMMNAYQWDEQQKLLKRIQFAERMREELKGDLGKPWPRTDTPYRTLFSELV